VSYFASTSLRLNRSDMLSRTLIKFAVAYFLVTVLMGNGMGMAEDFRLKHVHVHFGLLGWASLSIIAMLYRLFPALEHGWLPRAHCWLHNIGLVVMLGGFSYAVLSGHFFAPPIAAGSLVMSLGIVFFAVNVFKHLEAASDADR
jgi:cbb3-type cytochrome oxidase subunit 1